jgi:uncharacterized protein (DUF305 family)
MMIRITARGAAAAIFIGSALVAAPRAARAQMPGMTMSDLPGMNKPVTIPKGAIFTEADVRFMQGMIGHHGQAVYMTSMAESHGANPRVLRLATKISQSQTAEIRLMQGWLVANHQFAPDSSAWRHMTMPGMLTAAQLKELAAAKGKDFDRIFLTGMIQHHEGALKMVDDLLATPQAAQDVDVSVFANDVTTVQTAEIGLMERLLNNL